MTRPAPFAPVGQSGTGGELVQSLTYRESYAPAVPVGNVYADDDRPARRRLTANAPAVLDAAAGGAWALVSIVAAGGLVVVLVLLLVRVVGWLA